jgi:hypothetical protein
MRLSITALLDDPRFIPFVYDYCDMRCESCRVTSRCQLFVARRVAVEQDDEDLDEPLALLRAVIEKSKPGAKAIAQLDLAFCDADTAPREPAIGHPLEFLARHYTVLAAQYFASTDPPPDGQPPPGSALDVVSWDHDLIAFKTYRALVSHFASERTPDLLPDALASAKSVLVCVDRSIEAWRSIAADEDDARVGGLIEVLEALRTGVEMRFPEARDFVRPGLDAGDA